MFVLLKKKPQNEKATCEKMRQIIDQNLTLNLFLKEPATELTSFNNNRNKKYGFA
jgi:hypothetical protein